MQKGASSDQKFVFPIPFETLDKIRQLISSITFYFVLMMLAVLFLQFVLSIPTIEAYIGFAIVLAVTALSYVYDGDENGDSSNCRGHAMLV